jgi:hypothetical protein
VDDPIQAALDEARRENTEGRRDNAERAYARAAELARAGGDERLLAHALRHLSELARERGETFTACDHASDAVALYRESEDRLGLANAIRLQAMSMADAANARACWQEARDLYSSLQVAAGVAECDRHLAA